VVTGVELDDAHDMGLLMCDDSRKICSFKEKTVSGAPGLINAGLYVLYPEDLAGMPESFSLEYDLFPKLAESGKLVLHHHRGAYWFDCGTAERLKSVRAHFGKISTS
jgi:NDP-sugar pyrophosphorylase family protein